MVPSRNIYLQKHSQQHFHARKIVRTCVHVVACQFAAVVRQDGCSQPCTDEFGLECRGLSDFCEDDWVRKKCASTCRAHAADSNPCVMRLELKAAGGNLVHMPINGLGVATAANFRAGVLDFLHFGGQLLDWDYDRAEFCARAIDESTVPRSEVFVTSKIKPTLLLDGPAEKLINRSLEMLNLSYVDLLLIHLPGFGQVGVRGGRVYPTPSCVQETSKGQSWAQCRKDLWAALEKAQKLGLARAIGVSNFNEWHLDEILELGTTVPVVNQIEMRTLHVTRADANAHTTSVPLDIIFIDMCMCTNMINHGHAFEYRLMCRPFCAAIAAQHRHILQEAWHCTYCVWLSESFASSPVVRRQGCTDWDEASKVSWPSDAAMGSTAGPCCHPR